MTATRFQRPHQCFRGQATRRNEWEYWPTYLLPVNGSHLLFQTYIWRRTAFALVQSCCLIPKTWVEPLKFRWYFVYELIYTLLDIYFRLSAAIFDSALTLTSDIIRTSPVVLPDPENMAHIISLLSHKPAEICVISYLLSVTGRHLRFLTNPHVGQSHL